jgi:class 3 adenylate cyclase
MDGAIDDLAVGGPPRDRTSTADERRSLLGASRDSSRPSISSATPNHGADSSGTRTPLTGRSSELLSTTTNALWPFPRAVVVFVSFTPPPGAAFEYEVVRDTVARIEVAARARGLQKVKTIGTMVLLVAGADGDGSGESVAQQQQRVTETAINAAEAALEIRRGTFVNTGLSSAGWKLRVGLHTGPIFGAVIGSQGLCFDIYGDTVNTASRMCTTATADAAGSGGHAVQCSEGFHDLLPREAMSAGMVGFATARRAEPVAVKGKGLMTVYAITEHSAAAAERLKTPANTTTRRVTAAPLVLPNPSHHDVHPDEVSPLTFHGTPLEAGGGVAAPAV